MSIDHTLIEKYKGLEFLAKQVVEGFITGLHKSPFHGFSVEFAEHRLYNAGESTRHIDWKLYARTEKLFTKRYEEETNLRCQLIIDGSSSMNFPKMIDGVNASKLAFSVNCSAALVQLFKRQRDAFGLSIFREEVEFHSESRSSQQHQKFIYAQLEALLDEEGRSSKTNAVAAIHEIAERIAKRSLVIIFSDMMDNVNDDPENLFSALQHLRHNKHEVVLFHVQDKAKEELLNFDNRPYNFVDMETGEEIKVNPSSIKKEFARQAEIRRKRLKIKCGQYQVDFVETDINEGIDKVLLAYLLKRIKQH